MRPGGVQSSRHNELMLSGINSNDASILCCKPFLKYLSSHKSRKLTKYSGKQQCELQQITQRWKGLTVPVKIFNLPTPEALTIHLIVVIQKDSKRFKISELSKKICFDNEDGICQNKFCSGILSTGRQLRLVVRFTYLVNKLMLFAFNFFFQGLYIPAMMTVIAILGQSVIQESASVKGKAPEMESTAEVIMVYQLKSYVPRLFPQLNSRFRASHSIKWRIPSMRRACSESWQLDSSKQTSSPRR